LLNSTAGPSTGAGGRRPDRMGWGGMDVPSITEARVRAIVRQLPPPLDAIVEKAKAEQAIEEEAARAAREAAVRQQNFKKMGRVASIVSGTGLQDDNRSGEPSATAAYASDDDSAPSRQQRKYNVDGHQRKARTPTVVKRPQAQVVSGTRSMTFSSSAALFHGRKGKHRRYPHDVNQHEVEMRLGSKPRHERVNVELREARLRKYDDDVEKMATLEKLQRTTMLTQADGEKLRFGRLDAAWDGRLEYSAPMHKRGQIATWSWRKGFFVLCEGLLHEFGDSSLTSSLVAVWPIYGASFRKVLASHTQYPHAFELTVNSYFVSDSLLASTEFACDTTESRAKWMTALERESLKVSKLFKGSHDVGIHMAQVDKVLDKALLRSIQSPKQPASEQRAGTPGTKARRGIGSSSSRRGSAHDANSGGRSIRFR